MVLVVCNDCDRTVFNSTIYLSNAGESSYWTYSGDAYWIRALLFLIVDLPALGVIGLIAISFLFVKKGEVTTKTQKWISYYVMVLFVLKFAFHFLISDKFIYFYMRNYFGPTIYLQKHPYEITSDLNIDKQLRLKYIEKTESLLLSAYAHETENIMYAKTLIDATNASRRREYISNCWRKVAYSKDKSFDIDSFYRVYHSMRDIEYTIVNSYIKYRDFNRNKHDFIRQRDTYNYEEQKEGSMQYCRNNDEKEILNFLSQVSDVK